MSHHCPYCGDPIVFAHACHLAPDAKSAPAKNAYAQLDSSDILKRIEPKAEDSRAPKGTTFMCPHCKGYINNQDGLICKLCGQNVTGMTISIPVTAKAEASQPAPEPPSEAASSVTIAELMLVIERDNARWWRDLNTGKPIDRNIGELLMLMVSELAEAMEGHRKNLMDDKLPHRKMFEVELADLVIRVLDTAVHYAPALESAIIEKLAYNRIREDHKEENRRLPNGKKY